LNKETAYNFSKVLKAAHAGKINIVSESAKYAFKDVLKKKDYEKYLNLIEALFVNSFSENRLLSALVKNFSIY